jgi:DNA invertase Pin-like site-specific DNA recombinase
MAKGTTNRKKRTKILADEVELANAQGQQTFTSEYRDKAFESSERSVNDLLNYFSATTQGTKKILPKEKRRYAVYLRKSTDDEAKQVRSLDDQRSECLKLASRLGVIVRDEDIFVESASAKTSGNRPIFDKMLMGFKTSKYHGLIAWSPDRLSRNMKEAGEVIEMIDHEEIQDLAFVTYQFDNSPNGKMMLGILFATSKQYSDKLAVDVKRGTVGNIVEGKYNGVAKKGYFVDSVTGYFTPDEYNWNLLRKAVDMRLYEGKNNVDIADFLNSAKLTGRKDQDDKPKSLSRWSVISLQIRSIVDFIAMVTTSQI